MRDRKAALCLALALALLGQGSSTTTASAGQTSKDSALEFAGSRPQRLEAPAKSPANAISLDELEKELEQGAGASSFVPGTPGPVRGIGPGSPIQMEKANAAGTLGTYICSASYLFQDPATKIYYLATAGHCLLDETAASSEAAPQARARSIYLCYEDCVNNYVGLGSYVEVRPEAAYPGYHPVAWAQQMGPGKDFGFIEIPRSLNDLLRPELWLWGGPTGFERPETGTTLVHYGFGIGLGQAFPTQGRLAFTVSSSKEEGHAALGWANGGDSGSAVGIASTGSDVISGDAASGVITHAITGVGAPLLWATDLEYGLDISQGALGFRPTLVTEGTAIAPSESDEPAASPSPSSSPTGAPSPTPSGSPSPSPSSQPMDSGEVAERSLSLQASASRIRPGRRVRLQGRISGPWECISGQAIALWVKRSPDSPARKIRETTSDEDGRYGLRLRPRRTGSYRTVVAVTERCSGARSRSVSVRVL